MPYAKTLTFLLLLTICFLQTTFAQRIPKGYPAVASQPAGDNGIVADEGPLTAAKKVPPLDQTVPQPSQRTSGVPFTTLGTASNLYSWTKPEQHLLFCDPETELLLHLHRQDVTIWGGGTSANGKLRYDISLDGGANFNLDVGELNPTYLNPARYPQILSFNPSSSSNPLDLMNVWSGATVDGTPDWNGVVSGVSNTTVSGTPSSTENYLFSGSNTWIPGSLCQGLPGEFWQCDMEYIGGARTGTLLLHKGVFNLLTQDVDWVIFDTIFPDYNLSFDGSAFFSSPNIQFSPDGMDGWLSLLGDLNGGKDSTFNPLLWHTTDGGVTWGPSHEVNLDLTSWIDDTLKTLWTDSLLMPLSSGIATCAFDHDITVDMDGNVHMGVVVGSRPSDPADSYQFSSDLAKFMADVYTTDGGVTWQVKYLAPVLTFRVILGPGGTSTLALDNQPQAARNADGSKVFFTWIDTDTCGGLFGTSDNILPNLRGVSWRVTDGHRTSYKLFTDKDLLIGENILFPSMAPITLPRGGTEHMFTGFPRMLISGDELQPCEYSTLINQTWFDDSEYLPDAMYPDLSWSCDFVVQTVAPQSSSTVLHPPYPNPSQGNATLSFELAQPGFAELQITDLQGRTLETLWQGDAPKGQQTLTVDLSDLPSGVYFCILREPEGTHVQKWVVTH